MVTQHYSQDNPTQLVVLQPQPVYQEQSPAVTQLSSAPNISYPENQQPFQPNTFTTTTDPLSPMEVVHIPPDLISMIESINNDQTEAAPAESPQLYLLQQAVPH